MFIEKNTRRFERFNLAEPDEIRSYEEILADPAIRIVSRRFLSESDSTTESSEAGSTTQSQTRTYIALEFEEVTL